MSRERPLTLLAAFALAGLTGCPISQPIIVTFPDDAAWTFRYRDALGEELGGGKASMTLSEDGSRLTMVLTEAAFGDTARFKGEILATWTEQKPWVPFRGEGTWFSGDLFSFSGCIDPRAGRVAPGAVAHLTAEGPRLANHPLLGGPCPEKDEVKRFESGLVDLVFTWQAYQPRKQPLP